MSNIKTMNKISYLNFFPYDQFRTEQEDIIKQLENASKERKNILLSAPNGTGKTIMALSALLPLALEKDLKIIYMCRTHTQNTRIIKELNKISNLIADNKLNFKVNGLSIRGRNEMCLNSTLLSLKLNPKESMSVCSDLRKNRNCLYFLNLLKQKDKYENPILIAPEIFDKPVDAEDLINFCAQKKICPYFLSKYLLAGMRLIICNYQWIFNPFIRENFLMFIGKELEDCIFVIDECHNAIDIATDVNSERLTPYSLRLCLRDLEMYRSPILMQSFIKILLNHLAKKKSNMRIQEKSLNSESFLEQLYKKLGFLDLRQFRNFITELQDFGASIHEERISKGEISRDYIVSLTEFWLKWISTYNLDSYFFSYNINENKRKRTISMEIIALDPREITIPILKSCYTSIHLSGTVNPYVYNNLIGLNESGKKYLGIIAKSPFYKENIKALITEGVDTRRENRTNETFKKMISKIEEVINCTPANVAVFCASYKILKSLLSNGFESIVQKNNKKLFIEQPGLSASENAMLIENYKLTSKSSGAVLLGVCGGRNSEGEDYPGDFMNSVIIAGFPYHLPTPRVEAKIKYYDTVFNKQGWDFAYLYPAIQRANQASGRPIRKIKDKGAIIFMDARFKQKFKWISDWIKEEIEIVPDKKGTLTQYLYPFWH
ncbi:MAG: helicase C-terminal domain-containing protein [Candidatus Heimdallarchaeota archaeon]